MVSVCHIAVLGLSGDGDSEGVGKSSFCSRFVRPSADDYRQDGEDHASVVSLSDFQEQEMNGDHFLYFGVTERREGTPPWLRGELEASSGATVKFHVVEHTELIDDSTYSPFRHTKPYVQRATQDKLRSNGKVSYVSRSKLGRVQSSNDTPREPFPADFHKHGVDGFVFVLDPTTSNIRRRRQLDTLDDCLKKLPKKKPAVVFVSKCDALPKSEQAKLDNDFDFVSYFGGPGTATASRDTSSLSRSSGKAATRAYKVLRQLACFFGSARDAIGVDAPFLYLASKCVPAFRSQPKPRSYSSLVQDHANLLKKVTEDVKASMRSQIMTYTRNWIEVERRLLEDVTDTSFSTCRALWGADHCLTIFRMRLLELKIASARSSVEKAAALALDGLPDSEASRRDEALAQNEKFMRTTCDHPDLFVFIKQPKMFVKALVLYGISLPEPAQHKVLAALEANNQVDSDAGEGWGDDEWDDSFAATQERPLPPPPDELLTNADDNDDEEENDPNGLYDVVVDHSPMPAKPKKVHPAGARVSQPEAEYALPRDAILTSQRTINQRMEPTSPNDAGQGYEQTATDRQSEGAAVSWRLSQQRQATAMQRSEFYSEVGPREGSHHSYDSVSLNSSGSEGPPLERRKDEEEVEVQYEDVSEQTFSTSAKENTAEANHAGKETPYETVRPKRMLPALPVDNEESKNYEDVSDQNALAIAAVEVEEMLDKNDNTNEELEDIGVYETVKPRQAITVPSEDCTYETVKPRVGKADQAMTVTTGGPKRTAYEKVEARKLNTEGKVYTPENTSKEPAYTMKPKQATTLTTGGSKRCAYDEVQVRKLSSEGAVIVPENTSEEAAMYSSVKVANVSGVPRSASISAPEGNIRPLQLLDKKTGQAYNRPPAVNQEPLASGTSSARRSEKDEAFTLEPNAETVPALPSYAIVNKGRQTERMSQTRHSSKSTTGGASELQSSNFRPPSTPTQSSANTRPASTADPQPAPATSKTSSVAPPVKPAKPAKKLLFGKNKKATSAEQAKTSTPTKEKRDSAWWETPPSSPQVQHTAPKSRTVGEEAPAGHSPNLRTGRPTKGEEGVNSPPAPPHCPPPPLLKGDLAVDNIEPPPPPLQGLSSHQPEQQTHANGQLPRTSSQSIPTQQSGMGGRLPKAPDTLNTRTSAHGGSNGSMPGNTQVPNNLRKIPKPYEEIAPSRPPHLPAPVFVDNLAESYAPLVPTSSNPSDQGNASPTRAVTVSQVNRPPIRRRTVSRPQRQDSAEARLEETRDTPA